MTGLLASVSVLALAVASIATSYTLTLHRRRVDQLVQRVAQLEQARR